MNPPVLDGAWRAKVSVDVARLLQALGHVFCKVFNTSAEMESVRVAVIFTTKSYFPGDHRRRCSKEFDRCLDSNNLT